MAKGKGQGEGSGAPSLKPVQNPDTFQTLNVLYQTAAFYSVRGALDDNRPASSKALGKRRASGDDDGDDEQSANAGAQMQPSSSSAAVLGRDSARTMQAIAKKALISLCVSASFVFFRFSFRRLSDLCSSFMPIAR